MSQEIFVARFSGATFADFFPDLGGAIYTKFWEDVAHSSSLPLYVSDFRCVSLFRNHSAMKSTGVEN